MPCYRAYSKNNLDLYREIVDDIQNTCNTHDVEYMIIDRFNYLWRHHVAEFHTTVSG
jgi:hypothetical protein